MRYTAGKVELCVEHGLRPDLHQVVKGRMVINERELKKLDTDVERAAEMLGGTLMTSAETYEFIHNNN